MRLSKHHSQFTMPDAAAKNMHSVLDSININVVLMFM